MRILYLSSVKPSHFKAYELVNKKYSIDGSVISKKRNYSRQYGKTIKQHEQQGIRKYWNKFLLKTRICNKFSITKYFVNKIIVKENPDIVHALGIDFWGFISNEIQFNGKIIITVLGADLFRQPFTDQKVFRKTKKALHNADIIHTPIGQKTIPFLKKHFNIPEEKIIAFPSYYDLTYIKNMVNGRIIDNFKMKYSLIKKDFIFYAPRGMRAKFKPIFTLIPAIKALCKDHPEMKFIIHLWGNEALKREFYSQVKKNKIGKNMVLIDRFLDFSEYINLLALSDAIISFAEDDMLGGPIIDAMYLEKPLLLSDIDIYRDFFKKNRTAILVKNYHEEDIILKIKYAYNNYSKLRKDTVVNRNSAVEEFGLDKSILNYYNLYKSLMNTQKKEDQIQENV